jgi:hypothetical protein
MTRTRSSRGRRRNRDRTESPDELTAGPVEAVSDASTPVREFDETRSNELNAEPPDRRRRRQRRQGQSRPEPAQMVQAPEPHPGPVETSGRQERPSEPSPDRRPRQGSEQDERRGRPPGESRDEAGRRQNRRRPARRPTIVPAVGEVFKPGLRISTVSQEPSAKWSALPIDNDGVPALGCPMLTRTRVGMPTAGGAHVPRCALALGHTF